MVQVVCSRRTWSNIETKLVATLANIYWGETTYEELCKLRCFYLIFISCLEYRMSYHQEGCDVEWFDKSCAQPNQTQVLT